MSVIFIFSSRISISTSVLNLHYYVISIICMYLLECDSDKKADQLLQTIETSDIDIVVEISDTNLVLYIRLVPTPLMKFSTVTIRIFVCIDFSIESTLNSREQKEADFILCIHSATSSRFLRSPRVLIIGATKRVMEGFYTDFSSRGKILVRVHMTFV